MFLAKRSAQVQSTWLMISKRDKHRDQTKSYHKPNGQMDLVHMEMVRSNLTNLLLALGKVNCSSPTLDMNT